MLARARDYKLPFRGKCGVNNNITDVLGVEVGYSTIQTSQDVHTGVTAIIPRGASKICTPCSAGVFSLNGNGELTGSHWLEEIGALTSPILITNTLAVGTCHRGVIDWITTKFPDAGGEWLLPVVAETYDGFLSDIRGGHVTRDHVFAALDDARGSCPIAEGSVGGGCGMNTYGYRAGSGSSSRVVSHANSDYNVGVFVQSNFGKRNEIVVGGVYLGEILKADNPMAENWAPPSTAHRPPSMLEGAGSIIAIVATDAPLLPGQCKALAKRVGLGMARTGTSCSHFSGDIFLAFSTANEGALTSNMPSRAGDTASSAEGNGLESLQFIPWGHMDKFYEAVAHATEEAILNALFASRDTVGIHGRRVPGLPIVQVVNALRERGALLGQDDDEEHLAVEGEEFMP
jgi:D-aminopeptidase